MTTPSVMMPQEVIADAVTKQKPDRPAMQSREAGRWAVKILAGSGSRPEICVCFSVR